MFKAVQALVALSLFSLSTSVVVASPSPATGKRDTATYCPYPSRSLSTRQSGNDLSFTGSQWIWTNEFKNNVAPVGTRAFRKTFSPPEGKTPSSLKIAFAVDNAATLFVNGEEIATEGSWFTAGTFCVPLKPCMNVIGFNATNLGRVPTQAGLLVTAEVTYTDGSTSHIASDPSWRTSGPNIPNGWEQLSFDDSSWATVLSEGPYPNDLYGVIPIAGSDAISIDRANWVWTDEVVGVPAPAPVPAGARAFRRTITLPNGHIAESAQILIAADNQYSVYVNGRFVGTGTNPHNVQRFTVNNIPNPTDKVVIAVYAFNLPAANGGPNAAGLLVSAQVTSKNPAYDCINECESISSVVTDEQWRANHGTPSGFEQPGFDDSAWGRAVREAAASPSSPWSPTTISSTESAPGNPLPGAPAGN